MKRIWAQGFVTALIVLGTFTIAAPPVSAATVIDFGSGIGNDPYIENGFSFDPSQVQGGQCSPDKPCLAINDTHSSEMTYIGGAFSLLGFNFALIGKGTTNILTVFDTNNPDNFISFSLATYLQNTYYTYVDLIEQFTGVLSITFSTPNGGQAHIDNVLATCTVGCPNETIPDVPLPAAFPLLIAGLGGLTWLGRRQRRSSIPAA